MTALHSLCLALLIGAPPVEAKFDQLAPVPRDAAFERSPGRTCAVVLIHGLHPHPLSNSNVRKAKLASWQQADSNLVRRLARDTDVFAFAYGQNVAVDQVSDAPALADGLRRVKALGYDEVVLVGHSAGGLVARHFVEDHPGAGVTRVVQVCAPNGGSGWGNARIGVRKDQEDFLQSLSKDGRKACLERRADRKVPAGVEFVCVVGTGGRSGDYLVAGPCQWPEDLQQQGIPAVAVDLSHWGAVHSASGADLIARLVRAKQPRWDAAAMKAARTTVLRERTGEP